MNNATNLPHADLIKDIKEFCDRLGMAHSRFGLEAVKDPSFLFDLERGRECRRATVTKARAYITARDKRRNQEDAAA